MAKSLYICYFGVREPLVQTQVIPYLREICKDEIEISLLTFEPDFNSRWTDDEVERERQNLKNQGINWHCLPYHKRFSAIATAYDIFCGAWFVWKALRRDNIDILHGRVHTPTLMGALARRFSRRKPKLLFDIRGFFPEEYTEGGMWKPGGLLFRSAKRVERWLLKDSDGFVVLTEKARDILFPGAVLTGEDLLGRPVEVIPCCVDVKRFNASHNGSRSAMRQRLGIGDRRVLVYVGSFGSNWYMPGELADFLSQSRRQRPDTFALILSQTAPELIRPLLESRGFSERDFLIQKVTPSEIPAYLEAADVGVSFIRPCFSKLASSPTKNAEYLAAGLPIVVNIGVGDTAEFTREDGVGCVVEEFTSENYASVLDEIERLLSDGSAIRRGCRSSAVNRFDLEKVGGKRYRRLYRKLLT
jgi:glycosyltransferase involved in cell wall biosynthesis